MLTQLCELTTWFYCEFYNLDYFLKSESYQIVQFQMKEICDILGKDLNLLMVLCNVAYSWIAQ